MAADGVDERSPLLSAPRSGHVTPTAPPYLPESGPGAELPPPYTAIASSDASGIPVINCRVCQSLINLDGKLHQHVVKCTVCNEATKMNKSHTWKHPERVAYDADVLKLFWEKKIELHTERLQSEDVRKHRSALDRLRGEWAQKLDDRHRMLQRPPQPSLRGAKSFHTPDKMAA